MKKRREQSHISRLPKEGTDIGARKAQTCKCVSGRAKFGAFGRLL